MKIITTTNARKNMAEIVSWAKYSGEVFGIGRRHSVDAVLIGFPQNYNKNLNEATLFNANSRSFDFLAKEKEIYSLADLKKKYV